MGRFVGQSFNRGATPGHVILNTSEYSRATGIGTTTAGSGNQVVSIASTFSDWNISDIKYNTQMSLTPNAGLSSGTYVPTGIITQFTETINGVSKTYGITYDSVDQSVTSILEIE